MSRRKEMQTPVSSWRDLMSRIPPDYEIHLQHIPAQIKKKLASIWPELQRNGAIIQRRERYRELTYRVRVRVDHAELGRVHRSIALPRCAVRGVSIIVLAFRIERMRQAEEKRFAKRAFEAEIRQQEFLLRVIHRAQMGDPEYREAYRHWRAAERRETAEGDPPVGLPSIALTAANSDSSRISDSAGQPACPAAAKQRAPAAHARSLTTQLEGVSSVSVHSNSAPTGAPRIYDGPKEDDQPTPRPSAHAGRLHVSDVRELVGRD
jgi:hypothetical protein